MKFSDMTFQHRVKVYQCTHARNVMYVYMKFNNLYTKFTANIMYVHVTFNGNDSLTHLSPIQHKNITLQQHCKNIMK